MESIRTKSATKEGSNTNNTNDDDVDTKIIQRSGIIEKDNEIILAAEDNNGGKQSLVTKLVSHVSNRIAPRGRPVQLSNTDYDDDDHDHDDDENPNSNNNNGENHDPETNTLTPTTIIKKKFHPLEQEQQEDGIGRCTRVGINNTNNTIWYRSVLTVAAVLYIVYLLLILQCWIRSDSWIQSTVSFKMNAWYKTLTDQITVVINKVSFYTLLSNLLQSNSLFAILVALLLWIASFVLPLVFIGYAPMWVLYSSYNNSNNNNLILLSTNEQGFVGGSSLPPTGYSLLKVIQRIVPILEITFRSSMILVFVFLVWCTVLDHITTNKMIMSVISSTIVGSGLVRYILAISCALFIIVLLRLLSTRNDVTTVLSLSTNYYSKRSTTDETDTEEMNVSNLTTTDDNDDYNDNNNNDGNQLKVIGDGPIHPLMNNFSSRQLLMVDRLVILSVLLLVSILFLPWYQIRMDGLIASNGSYQYVYYIWNIPKVLGWTNSLIINIILVLFVVIIPIITHALAVIIIWVIHKSMANHQSTTNNRYYQQLYINCRYWLYVLHPVANGALLFGIALLITLYTFESISTNTVDAVPMASSYPTTASNANTITDGTSSSSTSANTAAATGTTTTSSSIWIFNNNFTFLPITFVADHSFLEVQGSLKIGGWFYLFYGLCTEVLIMVTLQWN